MSSSKSLSSFPRQYYKEGNLADIFFQLAVNFLLYVVLIIVFYMLVRFYLEEEVENMRPSPSPSPSSKTGGGFSYVPVATEEDTNDNLTSSPPPSSSSSPQPVLDQDTGIEMEPVLDGRSTAAARSERPSISTQPSASSKQQQQQQQQQQSLAQRFNSFLTLTEHGGGGSIDDAIKRAVFCALGLNVSFCIWGLLQERMLTQTYDGEYFVYSYGLVFMNRLGGLVLSLILMHYYRLPWTNTALWEYSFPSVANMLSSWCQYEALRYISFPMAMLAKAFKMVPVMLMGKLLNNKSYDSSEYLSGFTIGVGLFLFLNSSEHIDLRQNVFGDLQGVTGALCGVVLLLLFLLFDSFTGQWQTRMFERDRQLSPLQMMLIMNAFSAVFSFVTLVHQEELLASLSFVYAHPTLLLHILCFCVSATVGQLFIFYTVKEFGAVLFAAIMSVRILFSTLLSCWVYGHAITELGGLGILLVFGAVALRIRRKTAGRPLLAFILTERDRQRARSPSSADQEQVLKEWHEHLDI